MSKKKKTKFFLLVESALFASLIYVLTCYVKIPLLNGYVHIGDSLIFLASSLLPLPYAVAASVIGGSLGDLIGGYFIWLPATVIIKALTSACFSNQNAKIVCTRNIVAAVPTLLLCAGGYYLFEALVISQNFVSPLVSVIPNLGQTAVSYAVYICMAVVLDFRPGLKKLLTNPKEI